MMYFLTLIYLNMATISGELKKFIRLMGSGIKSMRPIFKTEMLIYQSKANLDEKFCLVESLIFEAQK